MWCPIWILLLQIKLTQKHKQCPYIINPSPQMQQEQGQMQNIIQTQLKHILKFSKCNHKVEIVKQLDIKHAHIYCKIHYLSGQVSGPLIEHYIKHKYSMIKNNSSLCIGDLQHNQTNLEIKISNGGKDNNRFNYVQLRMNHNCEYILTAYYVTEENVETLGELFIFKLNKNDMKKIILKYGGYAHGTIQKLGGITEEELNNPTNDKEYAIRPKYGDKCWCELLPFRIPEIGVETDQFAPPH
jgi:hypothetical protein